MDRHALISVILGAVLLLCGILGFIWNPLFGLFRNNPLYLLVLLASSWLLIWAGVWAEAGMRRAVGVVVGVGFLLLAVLGFFIPGVMANALSLNNADILLNAAVGLVGLDAGFEWI